ncbi:hypothetical protein R1sor_019160 [Riccia sorocarpa]|uniref:Uncharacterized protein n=1 Tax=Riccia sorocarpa TaxID=122646 RepID=A0ABD3IBR1_9MARC
MTRLPRPKYPSDSRNFHKVPRPGYTHTIRLPEELLETYCSLKRALGLRSSHEDVLRFLFEAAKGAITAVLQLFLGIDGVSDDEIDLEAEFVAFAVSNEGPEIIFDSQQAGSSRNLLRTYRDAEYGLWSKSKVKDFFFNSQFTV